MNEVLFDVVFKGKFASTIDQSKAIVHFSKLFKLPVSKAEKFFDGQPRTLKKSLSLDKASHFRAALKKAGLKVTLAKQQSVVKQKANDGLTLSEVGVVIVNQPFVQPLAINTSHFSLDVAGAQLVEFKPIHTAEFDLQDMDLDEVGVQLVEQTDVEPVNIDTSDLEMEEVGAIFAEKPNVKAPVLDISTLSMDEVGATLVEKKTIKAPEINTDGIQLKE